MDRKEIVDSIIESDNLKNLEEQQAPIQETGALPDEPEELFFSTFKNIKGQLYEIREQLKQVAYDEACEQARQAPSYLIDLAKIEQDEQDYADGKTRQHPHGDLRREKLESDVRKKGEEAKKKATPKTPLGVALFLRKYIRFVRIKPAVRTQKAPLYFYNPDKGYYLEDNEFLKDLIDGIYPNFTEKQAEDVLYKIGRKSPLKDSKQEYTAWGNCLYNYKTNQTTPFMPKIIVTRKIATAYNAGATEPTINGWTPRKWLLELFDNDQELYDLAIQMIKACITGQSLKKIFWLYGDGGTGKGTLQQLIINLIGIENVATLKITELNKSRFTNSILVSKSVVIGDDVQKNANIKDTSDLFSLTTGDILTIEEKGKKPYSLQLQMTVIQSSNGLPIMDGDVDAINRRFRILPFTKKFKGKPNKAIKDTYITRQDVLEYLLKLAIETPTKDINPQISQDILTEHQKDMNPVIAFIPTFFTDDLSSEFIPNSFVWHIWKGFLEYYGYHSYYKENALHREIKSNLPQGFNVGQRNIPKDREHHIGFYPKDDTPFYASLTYSNGRQVPEKRKGVKQERGYWNLKKKKR